MISNSTFEAVNDLDLVPQAVLARSVSYFKSRKDARFVFSHDAFDEFEGAAFVLNGKLHFALKHYKGHPEGTVTIYLPHRVSDVSEITEVVHAIMSDLDLGKDVLLWQRADNPEL